MAKKNMQKYPEFDTVKKPKKCVWYLYIVMIIASCFMMIIQHNKIKKINCKGLKGPYIVLSTHHSMLDFDAAALATIGRRMCWLVSIEEYNRSEWLMRSLGCICKRKFTNDILVVKHIFYALRNLKANVIIYPEARFSLAGINEHIDGALGKLVKKCNVPLVILRNYGHFINSPQWSKHPYRKIKMVTEMEQVVTREELATITAEEIQARIEKGLVIDEYKYQHDNSLKVNNKHRLDNAHKVLYKCPDCGQEFMMEAKGTTIHCKNCGLAYELDEYGYFKNINGGEAKFKDIPEWYRWEREEVNKEVNTGKYHFEDDIKLEQLFKPRVGFVPLGTVKFIHDYEGMHLKGKLDDGSDFDFFRPAIEQESCHVEYFFKNHKKEIGSAIDFADISKTYFGWLVNKKEALTKIHFATEAIHKLKKKAI